ncbi:hypothetical protein ACIA8F_13805 [Streptomyces sp. NPDC051563]|uniref:hypothetical protein n=1 Tax=Streptomyces sp. NPDC051563 TaxID=3365659 RepID=UPI0037BDE918
MFVALLLALLVTATGFLLIARHSGDTRREEAFEDTRVFADRFVDQVLARKAEFPFDQQEMRKVITSGPDMAPGQGTLYDMRRTDTTVRVLVYFATLYERSSPILGSAQARAQRCFTVTFSGAGTDGVSAAVTAHDRGTSCAELVER